MSSHPQVVFAGPVCCQALPSQIPLWREELTSIATSVTLACYTPKKPSTCVPQAVAIPLAAFAARSLGNSN